MINLYISLVDFATETKPKILLCRREIEVRDYGSLRDYGSAASTPSKDSQQSTN